MKKLLLMALLGLTALPTNTYTFSKNACVDGLGYMGIGIASLTLAGLTCRAAVATYNKQRSPKTNLEHAEVLALASGSLALATLGIQALKKGSRAILS